MSDSPVPTPVPPLLRAAGSLPLVRAADLERAWRLTRDERAAIQERVHARHTQRDAKLHLLAIGLSIAWIEPDVWAEELDAAAFIDLLTKWAVYHARHELMGDCGTGRETEDGSVDLDHIVTEDSLPVQPLTAGQQQLLSLVESAATSTQELQFIAACRDHDCITIAEIARHCGWTEAHTRAVRTRLRKKIAA